MKPRTEIPPGRVAFVGSRRGFVASPGRAFVTMRCAVDPVAASVFARSLCVGALGDGGPVLVGVS